MGNMILPAIIALALLLPTRILAAEVVIPSDISVHLSAQPDTHIVSGEPIIFTLTVTNHGPEVVNDFGLISTDFYDQIDLNFGAADCQGLILSVADRETFHFNYSWYPTVFDGPLAVGESRTCHITLALTDQAPPVWTFGFGLRTYYEDIDPTNNLAEVILRRGGIAPVAIPMLSPNVMLLLAIGLITLGYGSFRQRNGVGRIRISDRSNARCFELGRRA